MKTTIILLVICLLFPCFTINAQSGDFDCKFTPSKEQIGALKNQDSKLNKMYRFLNQLEREDIPRIKKVYQDGNGDLQVNYAPTAQLAVKFIPIAAHVLRRDNGTGGLTEQEILDAIDIVNDAYQPINFIFQLCSVEFIDSTFLYSQTFAARPNVSPSHTELLDIPNRNVPRKINIYFFPNGAASWTTGPNLDAAKQHVMMVNNHALTGVIMAHELGHWFSLFHTHHNFNDPANSELVDGSNCSVAGDFLCDTAADPNLTNTTDANCQYIQNPAVVDANGDTYQPDPTNLMSYSGRNCFDRFSAGQNLRMLVAYLNMQQDRGYTLVPCSPLSVAN